MSRTYKDEPYSVRKNNRKKYTTYTSHNHHRVGEATYTHTSREVILTVGERLEKKYTPVFPAEYSKHELETLQLFLTREGNYSLYYKVEEVAVKTYSYEYGDYKTFSRTVSYKNCLDEEGNPRELKHKWDDNNLCSEEIVDWQLGLWRGKPRKSEAKGWTRSRRGHDRLEDLSLKKMYNAGEDLEEVEYEGVGRNIPNQYWD